MQRPNRYLGRSDMMSKSKRILDRSEVEEDRSEPKRLKVPALASVIVEALKVDSLQKLCSSLEPILRRVVSEEADRALAKLSHPTLGGRSSLKRIEGSDGRNLQLHFRSRLSLALFTGGKVEGEHGAPMHVVLIDATTDRAVTSGPESSLKLDVVVLEGDFNNEDDEDWTQEDFESHVVKEREGKRPLLTGDLQMTLKEGVGTLGEVTFTDNSSWIRSRKFRLGLKVASGFCEGIRVREAKTVAFVVKDHRGELYKKHHPPASNDEVWRLEKIGKDGSFHKKLNDAGIHTVEDFRRALVRDTQRLRTILGTGMSNKMWEVLVEHSKTCVLSGKLYIYYSSSDDQRNVGVVFNHIYELHGLIVGEQYYSAESLSDSQKVHVDALAKNAYENWMHVVEYDGKELVNFKQIKAASVSQYEHPMGASDRSFSFDQQLFPPRLPVVVPPDQVSVDSEFILGGHSVSVGYNGNLPLRYPTHSPQIQFESTAIPPQSQLISSSHQTQIPRNDSLIGLALCPPQLASDGFHAAVRSSRPSELNNPYDEYISEEEIRMRSHEMLQNEEMQHLLGFVNMGGGSFNGTEDGFHFAPSPSLNFNFGDDQIRSSGKAVVGWLKLKAALRWGIFIRKKAAKKRAQLVELDY